MMENIYNKLVKLGKKWDKGLIGRIVDKINTDPNAGWVFLTTVLGVGALGIGFCLVWFYFLIKAGMPVGWIIFDTAIVIFCGWAIIKGIIPMSKTAYKQINKQIREKDED